MKIVMTRAELDRELAEAKRNPEDALEIVREGGQYQVLVSLRHHQRTIPIEVVR